MEKKVIVLGVTGGIAAYKSAQLASNLLKKGYDVHVIMTPNATEFVTPLTFEVLTNNKVAVDTFDRNFEYNVNHVSLAKKADLFLIAPATANVIAKFANGIADDMLTTSYLAFNCPKLVAPAMNTKMLNHVTTQRNLTQLKADGVHIVASGSGYLACGDIGAGRLAELVDIETEVQRILEKNDTLAGKKIVITAGPTREKLDPVRFMTNHSSGKMGYALATVAHELGADVTLITGPTNLTAPSNITVISVESANEMAACAYEQQDYDVFIGAAAVSDYRFAQIHEQKMKKNNSGDKGLTLHLEENEDIIATVAKNKKAHQKVVAFAMETQDLVENAMKKLVKKQVDLVVANDLMVPGAGFGVDTNKVILVKEDGVEELELMSKNAVAKKILESVIKK